jgi:hypothetical protein
VLNILSYKDIPDETIQQVTQYINERSNKTYSIPPVGISANAETPQVFEIHQFTEIDKSTKRFYAIDGSYNSQEFYNGLSIAVYDAGYVCYQTGKPICLNNLDDPLVLGKIYYPDTILLANEIDYASMYEEMINLEPVKNLINFCGDNIDDIFAYKMDAVCQTVSSLLGFCQEILEWSLVFEILNLPETKIGDFILKDGPLRSLNIKQKYLVNIGKLAHKKSVRVVGITKKTPVKLELNYTFRQIDDYLQEQLKSSYPFKEQNPLKQKLCCWFEVPMQVLNGAYKNDMYLRKALVGGRGFGIFHAARLDYVEKLQNYDWVITDLNIFDVIPEIENNKQDRDMKTIGDIHKELTRLTQEHYILGYPYPLVEAHNFVSLKKNFREEVINLIKLSLYKDKRMDHIDIENLFLDSHDLF